MIKTAEEFVKLRTSSDFIDYIRSANEDADINVWMDVIKNYPEMKKWIAHNKTIPIEIIQILAKDSDATVRSRIGSKRKTPASVLFELATDSDERVRMAVARNKKTTPDVLKLLLNDSWESVVEVVRSRLGL